MPQSPLTCFSLASEAAIPANYVPWSPRAGYVPPRRKKIYEEGLIGEVSISEFGLNHDVLWLNCPANIELTVSKLAPTGKCRI
jgi:hypothetical protein